jgi:hypothetical protein
MNAPEIGSLLAPSATPCVLTKITKRIAMKTKFLLLATLLASSTPCLAGQYQLDDPSGRQFLPDSVNNMIDAADRFKDRLDAMSDSASSAYGNARERLNSLTMGTSEDSSARSSGYSSQAKRTLGSMGSGGSATDQAYSASVAVRAKQYSLDQQRNRCPTMRAGSREQALCDLKAMCMDDDLKRVKSGFGMGTESPNMAAGQCDGPNPTASALAQAGDSTLMGMLGGNGSTTGASPLDGLMQDQQRQEAAAVQAEAERQASTRRQQAALAEQQRQAEIQRQQQVAAAQAEDASSDDGMLGMAMGLLGAAANVYGAQRAARPTGNGYTSSGSSGTYRVIPSGFVNYDPIYRPVHFGGSGPSQNVVVPTAPARGVR